MLRSKFSLLKAGLHREWLRGTTLVRLLSKVPVGWVVLLGILGLPVFIITIAFAFLVIIFLLLLVVVGLLFALLVLRPMLGSRKRSEKVIEVEYKVISGPGGGRE